MLSDIIKNKHNTRVIKILPSRYKIFWRYRRRRRLVWNKKKHSNQYPFSHVFLKDVLSLKTISAIARKVIRRMQHFLNDGTVRRQSWSSKSEKKRSVRDDKIFAPIYVFIHILRIVLSTYYSEIEGLSRGKLNSIDRTRHIAALPSSEHWTRRSNQNASISCDHDFINNRAIKIS